MYTKETLIRMHHTDAAGLIFFANLFVICHEAAEDWMIAENISIHSALKGGDYITPVVHAEGDYKHPMRLEDRIRIDISIEKIGESSFTLYYRLTKIEGNILCAEAKTVNVSIDAKSGKKIPLPSHVREALERLK
jgi:1,4-dihydroxy-2-naphthoyl-CoA hydrolase